MHIKKILLVTLAILLTGCAAYKELKPEPEVNFLENGYLELKDDKDLFELSEGKKYFMKFPGPVSSNIYLVIEAEPRELIRYFVTRDFEKEDGPMAKMPDKSLKRGVHSVYELDPATPTFFWVIDTVKHDLLLDAKYRYVAAWRYKFENSYNRYQNLFEENSVDRANYNALGTTLSSEQLDVESELNSVRAKTAQLSVIQAGLAEIESIFPPDIKNSSDPAYLDYTELKINVDNELVFQEKYNNILSVFNTEKETRGNSAGFAASLSDFRKYLSKSDEVKPAIKNEICTRLSPRLNETLLYFENEIRDKRNRERIELNTMDLEKLFIICKSAAPAELRAMSLFIDNYNNKLDALEYSNEQFRKIRDEVANLKSWPTNTFYKEIQRKTYDVKRNLPDKSTSSFGKYKSYRCSTLLEAAIVSLHNEISRYEKDYEQANATVQKINARRQKSDYSGIIRLLKQNNLSFLNNHYSNVDQLSMYAQRDAIKSSLRKNAFASAESALRNLHEDRTYLSYNSIRNEKSAIVRVWEDSLMTRIEKQSVSRVNAFINRNLAALDGVSQLYSSEAFAPAHSLQFASGLNSQIVGRKTQLAQTMDRYKTVTFPSRAIETIYRDFSRDIGDNGVKKARAIITHGQFYKGSDKNINNLVAECDPDIPKTITKPAQYRKIYVIPTTDNATGNNSYAFKLNIQIPSDAKFPVYDVNIKLAQEVATQAARSQWYESISINGSLIKNEGRFSITSPGADNDYECQVTPVRTNKGQDNIFEVKFDHNSLRAYEFSVMVQKPIIRKN